MYESLMFRTLYNVDFYPVLTKQETYLAKIRYNRILALILSAVCAILSSEHSLVKE